MWQVALTIFYVVWLCGVLGLLYLIWHDTRKYIRLMEHTMLEARAISAQAALKAAEAAERLAEILQREREDHSAVG